jgi:hypothetical protein
LLLLLLLLFLFLPFMLFAAVVAGTIVVVRIVPCCLELFINTKFRTLLTCFCTYRLLSAICACTVFGKLG